MRRPRGNRISGRGPPLSHVYPAEHYFCNYLIGSRLECLFPGLPGQPEPRQIALTIAPRSFERRFRGRVRGWSRLRPDVAVQGGPSRPGEDHRVLRWPRLDQSGCKCGRAGCQVAQFMSNASEVWLEPLPFIMSKQQHLQHGIVRRIHAETGSGQFDSLARNFYCACFLLELIHARLTAPTISI